MKCQKGAVQMQSRLHQQIQWKTNDPESDGIVVKNEGECVRGVPTEQR